MDMALEGLHPTTVSCLEALQAMAGRPFSKVLDMGCGTGILSVMAVHWWNADVVAADIAPEAVADTQVLADAHAPGKVRSVRSDLFSDAAVSAGAPYDLIIFNLLAEPFIANASQVKAHLAAGGVCVLSGILSWLEPGVVAAYEGLGFTLLQRVSRNPWQTLVFTL